MTRFFIAGCCLLTLSACGNNTTAKTLPPEYIYQTKIVDLKPTAGARDETVAIERANKSVEYNSKNECRRFGYGWTLEEIKNSGELSCEKGADSRSRCQMKSAEIKCRRIKPGSVGMGMIPFTQ
jgi:hypothetical protein